MSDVQGLPPGIDESENFVIATGSPTPRILGDRAHDWINVLDYGAKLDGTTDDSAAFQAAVSATSTDGTIVVPRGGYRVLTPPTRSSGNVLWKLDGNTQGTGTLPVIYAGGHDDVTETFIQGRKKFAMQAVSTTPYAVVDISLDYNNPTAPSGGVASALHVGGTAEANAGGGFFWGINADVTSYSAGVQQDLAGSFSMRKFGAAPVFALYAQGFDNTGLPSSTGGNLVTCEIDFFANQLDDVAGGGRGILSLVYGRAPVGHTTNPMSIHTALAISPKPADAATASVDRLIAVTGNFNQAAFDIRGATQGVSANAIWMSPGDRIAFDDAATMTMSGSAGTVSVVGAINTTGAGIFQTRAAVGTTAGTSGVALDVQGTTVGIRLSAGTYSAAAIRMATDQKLSFNATDANYLQWTATGGNRLRYMVGANERFAISDPGALSLASGFGAFGTVAVTTKPTVSGAKGSNAALASLMTALAAYGLVTDTTAA